MHIRSLLLTLVFVLLAAFVALNWGLVTAPTDIWLGFTTVYAPVGVILLGVIAFISLLFLAWVIYLQGTVILETRRQTKELHAQRELADKAEASRIVELRSFLGAELLRLSQAVDENRLATQARFTENEQKLYQRIDEHNNSIAAQVGELEDRLERRNRESVELAMPGPAPE